MEALRTVAIAGCLLAASATGSTAEPLVDCGRARDPAARVAACNSVIAGAGYATEHKALAYRNRGLARADAGAHAQAVADLSEAIRLTPGDAAAYAGRAHARLARGETGAAIADLDSAIRLAPRTVAHWIGRGHAHLVRGDAQRAIADFTEAVRLAPDHAAAYNNRGLAYRRKGDIDAALADYTMAIVLNPIYALAYNNRGYAHEAKGMRQEAIGDLERALQLDRSLTGAAAALKRLGHDPAATSEADKLIGEGKALVEAHCARCHAVDRAGSSPHPMAPEFRQLHRRHPVQALREPLTRGMAAPHDEMPRFQLPERDIDKVVAYINSLAGTPPVPARKR